MFADRPVRVRLAVGLLQTSSREKLAWENSRQSDCSGREVDVEGKQGRGRIGRVEVQSILSRRLECDDDDDEFRLCLFTLCSFNLQACPTNQPTKHRARADRCRR